MESVSVKNFAVLIKDIVWHFGAQGLDGQCCVNLSTPEARALRLISNRQFCSMQEIARGLSFSKSGATRVIDRLEKKGLVRRKRSPEDGRVCCVEIAAPGEALIGQIDQENERQIEKILSKLEPSMQQVVQASLYSLVQAINGER
jgi:MarR family 2-MHQ and catechol resistance regulon transcriptional repressor